MTFLELCQFTHRYIAGGNELPGTAPLDVSGQSGKLFSLVKSVQDAYLDILTEQDNWTFMQKQGSLAVASDKTSVSKATIQSTITDYDRVVMFLGDGTRYILCGLTSDLDDTQAPCHFIGYQQWRGWKDRPPISTGKPAYFTVQPDESLAFDVKTDAAYTLKFDYYRTPPTLSENTDKPIFPSQFHAAVAWRAVRYWALTNEVPAKFELSNKEYERIMNQMRSICLPGIVFDVREYYGQ